jgi:hypothetical protein
MNGILLPSIVENISTRRDGSIKVTLGTQELSQGKAGELFILQGKLAAVYISAKDTITQAELNQVDNLDPEIDAKTPGQRLRSVLYILWSTTDEEGHKTFDTYYKAKMETIISHMKSKIKD